MHFKTSCQLKIFKRAERSKLRIKIADVLRGRGLIQPARNESVKHRLGFCWSLYSLNRI